MGKKEIKELLNAISDYVFEHDCEWEFADEHGTDAAYWTDEDVEEHESILAACQRTRENLSAIMQRLGGKAGLDAEFMKKVKL